MKKSRILVSAGSIFCLLFFFIASTTNLIIPDYASKVYNIAILSDTTDGNTWNKYIKGVNVASKEYNVELTILNEQNYDNIVSYLSRELRYKDNKIDGIVMVQNSMTNLEELVERMNLPVVYVENGESDKEGIFIGVNSYCMGQDLGKLIVNDIAEEKQNAMVYLIDRTEYYDSMYYDGIANVLEDENVPYHRFTYSNVVELIQLQELTQKLEKQVVLVGCDARTVETLVDVYGEELEEKIRLYGNQSTNKIIHFMEKEYVKAITVKDDFNTGYLSVEKIVSSLEKKNSNASVLLDHFLIKNDEIYKKENEAVLFPIP